MPHEFVLLVNGELKTYSKFEDIPEKFDNVIKFLPEIPEPPHTEHQHEEMDVWNDRLKELLSRETNGN
jgi:predicted alternative tryptophan synthase beta-subunit